MSRSLRFGHTRRVANFALADGLALACERAWAGAAPDFAATSLEGDEMRLSSYRGRVVLIDFWASWCPPCREELAQLAKLEKEMPDLVVLAINVDTRRDRVLAYAKRATLPRRVLLDPKGSIAAHYAPQGMPWIVLVDARGNVASTRGGWGKNEIQDLVAQVRQLQARSQ